MISTTSNAKKKKLIQKINVCQYYVNLSSQYSQNISTISFINNVKIK